MITTAAVAGAEDFPTEPYDFILAKLAASEGRYADALARIDRVLETRPTDPVVRYERAMMLIDASRIEQAEQELRKVVAASPEFYDAHRILGRLLLDRAGNDRAKIDEAVKHLKTALALNPDDLSTGIAIAQILVGSGKFAEAETVIASLLERAPDQRSLHYTYAQILTKLGRGAESRPYLERVLVLDPTFGPAALQLADIYQKENEWLRVAEVLQPLVDEDPLNLELQRQQAFSYLRAGVPEKARDSFAALVKADPTDKRSRYYLAEALSDLNEHAEADAMYRKLMEEDPSDVDVIASYALSQLSQHKLDDAARQFQSILAMKDAPDNLQVLARTQMGNIELQRDNHEKALDLARTVLVFRDKPNNQAVNIALGALKKMKREEEALALLQPLVDKFGSDPFVNSRHIEMLVRTGKTDEARTASTTQLKFGTRNTVSVAEAWIQAGQAPEAIKLLLGALKTKPDEVDINFELGSAYERSGDTAAAEKVFLRILESNPDHAPTLNYLGYMWADGGVHLERATEMLTRAVGQEPSNGAFVDSLGWVYFRQGKLDLAEKYLSDAARLLPRDSTVHEHLADVVAKRGDYTRALELYRVALALEPEAKDEAKIRSKMAEVEKQTQTSRR